MSGSRFPLFLPMPISCLPPDTSRGRQVAAFRNMEHACISKAPRRGRNSCLFFILLHTLLLAIGQPIWAAPVLAVPNHTNHTFAGQEFAAGDCVARVVSVGDVVGENHIIVWLELRNKAAQGSGLVWSVSLYSVRARVGGGEWRPVYCSSSSEEDYSNLCTNYYWIVYRHHLVLVQPQQTARLWLVFRLTKYEFDAMRNLTLEIPSPSGKITAAFNTSGDRAKGPYIGLVRPQDGEVTTWLSSIEFQVLDLLESLPVNWSVEMDGEFLLRGTANPPGDPCPIDVERSLSLSTGLQALPYGEHEVIVKATNGRVEDEVRAVFTLTPPVASILVEEWTINTTEQFGIQFGRVRRGSPTVWDVDGDGTEEILFGNQRGTNNRMWCFDAHGSMEWIYPPIDQDGLSKDPETKASLVDVDGDGVQELCFLDLGGRLHVLDGDGGLVWAWDTPGGSGMRGPPQAMDVDGDAFPEFFLADGSGYVYRVSHEGELVWTSFQTGSNTGQPTIADIDQDGEFEVLWTSLDQHVYCASARDGFEEWRFDADSAVAWSPVVVADLDLDAEYEALVWTEGLGSSVICLSSIGEEIWRWTHPRLGTDIRMCQAMGDVDGDGSLDLAVMTQDNAFLVDLGVGGPLTRWELNFTQLAESGVIPPGAVSWRWSSYQIICDFDGDGGLDVVWLVPYPVVVDGVTGTAKAFYLNDHIATNIWSDNGAWWGDLDGDGSSEYLCEIEGKSYARTLIYCLTMSGRFPAESPWPEYYHTAYPAEYQQQQDWLTLKSAYSNSLWFPIAESNATCLLCFLLLGYLARLQGASRAMTDGSPVIPYLAGSEGHGNTRSTSCFQAL